jgi:hypothetical protein
MPTRVRPTRRGDGERNYCSEQSDSGESDFPLGQGGIQIDA